MKNKIIIISSLLLLLTFGFLYINKYYTSNNKGTLKHSCAMGNSTQNMNAEQQWPSYEFITDKACCDEMRSSMQKELMGLTGVKEVKFSPSCSVSKMTKVAVYFSGDATNADKIASYLKDKNLICSDPEKCTPDKMNQCPHKEKNKESKNI
jgi:hypothetical protein